MGRREAATHGASWLARGGGGVTWRDGIRQSEVEGAADMFGVEEKLSGGARMKKTRVSSANLEGLHIFIGRGS